MPVNNPGGSGGGGAGGSGQQQGQQGGAQRATFRPPWVKQGPQPIPMPSAPWSPNRRASNTAQDAAGPAKEPAPVRKQSKITIIPSHPTNQSAPPPPKENGQNAEEALRRPSLANLVAIEDQPSLWDDEEQDHERDAEPDWWRDMQQTAREDVGQAEDDDVQHQDHAVDEEEVPKPDVDGELAEQASQWRRDDQEDGGLDCQGDDVNP
ncbi:splicing factor, arginine/serine-rich 19-like [Thrips palmi]|uniref:Splicing factor, arginine/serine-rich 19-like n=1 Tax=Thrips palmi TaxID=161013 RepID=A0A6P8YIN1_THRPL|nr:splicing factor, arginine/serine-rich 19-like [Thrips palmi]XP_034236866.1 splicing factor, arginine/serine-rich 19-like [Thrips palmi]